MQACLSQGWELPWIPCSLKRYMPVCRWARGAQFGQRMLVSVVESAAEEGTMTQADVNAVMQRTWASLLLAYQDAGGLKLQSLDESLPATTEGLSWVDRQEAAFRSLEVCIYSQQSLPLSHERRAAGSHGTQPPKLTI
jgi:hypothetical protein